MNNSCVLLKHYHTTLTNPINGYYTTSCFIIGNSKTTSVYQRQLLTRSQVPSQAQNGPKLLKQQNCEELEACFQLSALEGVEGVLKLRDGTRKSDKLQLLTRTCIKPTNKLVSSLSGAPLMLRQAMGDSGLTSFTTARTRGEATTFPHIVFSTSLRGTHIRMAFCPGTPKEKSRNYPCLDSRDFTRS